MAEQVIQRNACNYTDLSQGGSLGKREQFDSKGLVCTRSHSNLIQLHIFAPLHLISFVHIEMHPS